MKEISINKIKTECQNHINKQEIIVSGFCDYNNLEQKSKNTKSYQYVQLISFDGDEKITVLDSKKLLSDGVFYRLKATVYFQQNSNEIALKDIEILDEDKNNLIYNYKHFSILKTKLKKGMLNINEHLTSLFTNNKIIKIGLITPSISVAYNDILTSLSDDNRSHIEVLKSITIDEFLSLDLKVIETDESEFDFWLMTRGGGNLSLFNSYNIIEKVSSFKKPLITALGHSTDYTLTDFMADKVFSTPTSFGEYLNNFFQKEKSKIEESKKTYSKYNEQLKEFETLKSKILTQSKEIERVNKLLNIQKNELEKYKGIGRSLDKITEILNSKLDHNKFISSDNLSDAKKLMYAIILLTIVNIII